MTQSTLRTVLAAITIAGAVHFSQQTDLLVDYTRPVVMSSLSLLGIEATQSAESIIIGKLEIPWTRDCSGMNLLLILMALAVWVNREEKCFRRFLLRVFAMIPAALLANTLRVLTLISYRTIFYPAVEGPQTHYFMGFLWLIPFIMLITPRESRPRLFSGMETLHAAAVIALLAPISGSPNATLVSLAAIVCLSQCKMQNDYSRTRQWLMLLWVGGGVGIGLVNMESFWLPWLLTCPLFADTRWLLRFQGILVLACTHAMIAMQPWAWGLAAGGAVAAWLSYRSNKHPNGTPVEKEIGHKRNSKPEFHWNRKNEKHFAAICSYAIFLLAIPLPFLASTVISFERTTWHPPAGLEARLVNQSGYEIKLPGQTRELGLICYFSENRDRHHTLSVCLKYRGIELENLDEQPNVKTDGRNWYREYFFHDETLHSDYTSYIESSFRPLSAPGLHLIFVSDREVKSPAEFNDECERFANEFAKLCLEDTRLAQK